jgi:hypothetical protein
VTPIRRRGGASRTLVVDSLRSHEHSIEGVIDVGTKRYRVFFSAPGIATFPGADAFVAILLLPAMVLGAELRVEGPVAPETMEAVSRVQALYARWFPGLQPIRVDAPSRVSRPRARGVLSPFTGGVDSFYTALTGHGRLTHLLFVHGFDIPLGAETLRGRVAAALRSAAGEIGLPLIEMETNARDFTDDYVPWDFAHGAGIAAAGMLLAGDVGEVIVPSSGEILSPSDRTRLLWGSHPELDPLWTTTEQLFVHHDADVGRQAKLQLLAASDTAMRYLRVCWQNPGDSYNCGRCEKCLRTMAGLRVLKASDRCRSFAAPLDIGAIERLAISEPSLCFWRELEEAAVASGDKLLASAIGNALRRRRIRAAVGALSRVLRRIPGARRVWNAMA